MDLIYKLFDRTRQMQMCKPESYVWNSSKKKQIIA